MDPDTTAHIKSLETAREELQAGSDAHLKRQSLVAPAWPLLPDPIDMQNPPTAATGERTSVALAVARWLERIAITWEKIEAERVARKYMPGDRIRRLTPIAVSMADR
jgi:hypothetical protein